jgi:UPF0176 protein
MPWIIATFYKFVPLENLPQRQADLLAKSRRWGLCGTILIAPEGLNATIAGFREGIDRLLTWLQAHPAIGQLTVQESTTASAPFGRMKVKIKPEIVTLGRPDLNPNRQVGTYVDPQDWNSLIQDPSVVLIDARNDFEVEVGTFQGAINPHTRSFRELPDYIDQHLNSAQHRKVAMFCTGGVRCEKATAYLREQGFEQVYHLKGGILNYLKHIPPTASLWQGDCFVFDDRVTVDHHLQPQGYVLCGGCGYPLSPPDQASPLYQPGHACPYCAPPAA